MKTVLSHPTGNTFSRALTGGLCQRNLLAGFCTTFDWPAGSPLNRLLPKAIRAELGRRDFSFVPSALRSSRQAWREAARLLLPRLGWRSASRHETGWCSVDAVYHAFDKAVAREIGRGHWPEAKAVYAYEDGALAQFEAARELGWKRLYDLPIAHWQTVRAILREETARHPEWAATVPGAQDSEAKLARKDRELALADAVIVPSDFVGRTLPDSVQSRVVVAEFGTPEPVAHEDRRSTSGPLRLLFAGALTLRKGLPDLFEALRLLDRPDIELVLAGTPLAEPAFYLQHYPRTILEGPRPHGDFMRLMATCHALVLPSLVEGRALVQQEAMACGLPIVITPNTGGGSLVIEGRTGFLIPIRSPSILADRLCWLADHRRDLPEMGLLAQAHARQFTWQRYVEAILPALTMPHRVG